MYITVFILTADIFSVYQKRLQ